MTTRSILITIFLFMPVTVYGEKDIEPALAATTTYETKADEYLQQIEKVCPSCALEAAFVGAQNELKCSTSVSTSEYKKIVAESKVYLFLLALGQQFDSDSIVPEKVRKLADEAHDCDENVWLAGLKIKMKSAPKSFWQKAHYPADYSDII